MYWRRHTVVLRMRTVIAICATVTVQVLASSGDRKQIFQTCLARCEDAQCTSTTRQDLSPLLRLTGWTCSDDCKYKCIHATTTHEVQMGMPIRQYYGKWPFWRLGGIQEPASVAFSLLNLWTHVRGLAGIRREVVEEHPMRAYYVLWSYVSMNTWIWSFIFHTRDKPITEKLDYFSAALTILYGLYIAVVRLFRLYSIAPRSQLTLMTSEPSRRRSKLKVIWPSVCGIAFLCHVSYLTMMPSFDYFYNVVFNAAIGVAHNILWLLYALPISFLKRFPSRPRSYRPAFVKKAGILVCCMMAATCLELFDFPPWGRVIDAHSLWHLSTALIAPHWYRFLIEDSRDESWHDHRL